MHDDFSGLSLVSCPCSDSEGRRTRQERERQCCLFTWVYFKDSRLFNEHVTLLMDISLVSACPPYAEVADITACKIRSVEMPLSDNCSRWHRM
jgi:hypothetical protein